MTNEAGTPAGVAAADRQRAVADLIRGMPDDWTDWRAPPGMEWLADARPLALVAGLVEARCGIRATTARGEGFIVPAIISGDWTKAAAESLREFLARFRVPVGTPQAHVALSAIEPSSCRLTEAGRIARRTWLAASPTEEHVASALRVPGPSRLDIDGEATPIGPTQMTDREAAAELLDAVRAYEPARRRYFTAMTGVPGGPWKCEATTDIDATDMGLTPIVQTTHPSKVYIERVEGFTVTDATTVQPIRYAPLREFRMSRVADGQTPEPHSEAWYRVESVRQALGRLSAIGRTMLRTIPTVLRLGDRFDVASVARLYAGLPDENFVPFAGPYQFPLSAEDKAAILAKDREACEAAAACLTIVLARIDAAPPQKAERAPAGSTGRPPLDDAGADKHRSLARQWESAKASGATRATFCAGHGIDKSQLIAACQFVRRERNKS